MLRSSSLDAFWLPCQRLPCRTDPRLWKLGTCLVTVAAGPFGPPPARTMSNNLTIRSDPLEAIHEVLSKFYDPGPIN